jgi:hypothetical protein
MSPEGRRYDTSGVENADSIRAMLPVTGSERPFFDTEPTERPSAFSAEVTAEIVTPLGP